MICSQGMARDFGNPSFRKGHGYSTIASSYRAFYPIPIYVGHIEGLLNCFFRCLCAVGPGLNELYPSSSLSASRTTALVLSDPTSMPRKYFTWATYPSTASKKASKRVLVCSSAYARESAMSASMTTEGTPTRSMSSRLRSYCPTE